VEIYLTFLAVEVLRVILDVCGEFVFGTEMLLAFGTEVVTRACCEVTVQLRSRSVVLATQGAKVTDRISFGIVLAESYIRAEVFFALKAAKAMSRLFLVMP
jgi:hypothetical protein